MILRRSPDSLTLVAYDGFSRTGIPVPWRVLWHEGPANWHPGDHLDEATVADWPELGDRSFERDATAKVRTLEAQLAKLVQPQLHSSYYTIVAAVLRGQDMFEESLEERAAQIVGALPRAEAQEIRDLKSELKRMGKAYGKASATIGHLRDKLGMARLYRACWAERQASDCAACRSVFAETPFYERVPTAEELANAPRQTIRLPADTPVIGKGQFEDPGNLEGLQHERSRFRPDAAAYEDDAEADAVTAQELADDEVRVCAAAYTDSGRDTGHALCGSPEGPVTLSALNVSCPDCVRLLENGWAEDED
jgi:hypothetical protein